MEKAMATHSSVLAWRIPGTGEPGGLPSVGSHRVGHDWSDLAAAAAAAGSIRIVLNCRTLSWCQNIAWFLRDSYTSTPPPPYTLDLAWELVIINSNNVWLFFFFCLVIWASGCLKRNSASWFVHNFNLCGKLWFLSGMPVTFQILTCFTPDLAYPMYNFLRKLRWLF